MKKKQSDLSKIGIVFVLLLVASLIVDFTKEGELKNGFIQRGNLGEEEKEVQLQLNVDGILEDYAYSFEVNPVMPTKEEADSYFKQAIAQIEEDFQDIEATVPISKIYADGTVKAKWSFHPFGIIDSEGKISYEKVEKEGSIIQAQAELTCGAYENMYLFSFVIKPPKLSEKEKTLQQIGEWLAYQKAIEGSTQIELPKEIDGTPIDWSEKRDYIAPQVLLVEGLAVALLWVITKRRQKEEEKKMYREMEKDYPDIVNQLALLLGAGMTTRQAWNRLGALYSFKKKNEMIAEKPVYEAVIRMTRRFAEGESERSIYQQFSEEIPVPCFRKLMRILLGSLEKGTRGICNSLEEENMVAFEQRILQAKKNGEEASTKMLLPLMLMMVIVMGIVMLPALIEFQI